MSNPDRTETTKADRPWPERRTRRWVREFWADRMRSGNAPDLPEAITIEAFQVETERLAARLAPKPERLF